MVESPFHFQLWDLHFHFRYCVFSFPFSDFWHFQILGTFVISAPPFFFDALKNRGRRFSVSTSGAALFEEVKMGGHFRLRILYVA